MEIKNIGFEEQRILMVNDQKVILTPFSLKHDPGNIKLGIVAPSDISVNREEIYIKKKGQLKDKPTATL